MRQLRALRNEVTRASQNKNDAEWVRQRRASRDEATCKSQNDNDVERMNWQR